LCSFAGHSQPKGFAEPSFQGQHQFEFSQKPSTKPHQPQLGSLVEECEVVFGT